MECSSVLRSSEVSSSKYMHVKTIGIAYKVFYRSNEYMMVSINTAIARIKFDQLLILRFMYMHGTDH